MCSRYAILLNFHSACVCVRSKCAFLHLLDRCASFLLRYDFYLDISLWVQSKRNRSYQKAKLKITASIKFIVWNARNRSQDATCVLLNFNWFSNINVIAMVHSVARGALYNHGLSNESNRQNVASNEIKYELFFYEMQSKNVDNVRWRTSNGNSMQRAVRRSVWQKV